MKKSNLFNKKLTITTDEKRLITIEEKQILIHGFFSFDGKVYVMNNYDDTNNIYIIREIYSFDDNRLRYSYDIYSNAKSFDTIERVEEGKEIPIMVIESYDDVKTYIGSIGNIKELISDKQIEKQEKNKILALLRKNKEEEKVA